MLTKISPQIVAHLKEHLFSQLPRWRNDSLDNFKYLAGGYSNQNYSFSRSSDEGLENFVLRLPKVQQPFVNREMESRWYLGLPDHIGVRPLALDTKSGVMITPMLDGQILAEVYRDNFVEQNLLDYVKILHLRLPHIEREYNMFEIAKLYEVDSSGLPPLDSLQLYQACHNDLNPWNIIVTEDGWRAIDWEFVGLNDPLFDLVALHQGLELSASGLMELSHQLIGHADPDRLSKVLKAFWYREWAWADFQMRAGNLREEIVAQHKLANERLAGL